MEKERHGSRQGEVCETAEMVAGTEVNLQWDGLTTSEKRHIKLGL